MTSRKFEELERRVKRIKTKKYIKLILLSFVLFGSTFYLVKYTIKTKPLHVEIKIEEKEVQTPTALVEAKELVQEKSREVAQKEEKIDYETIELSVTIDLPDEKKLVPKIEKQIVKVEQKEREEQKFILHVKEINDKDALLERFGDKEDFESAIGLARLYFEDKKFVKSIYWSRKASNLNPKNESSWIIFSKSKQALGESEDAIKALQVYLEHFSSQSIENLLKQHRSQK